MFNVAKVMSKSIPGSVRFAVGGAVFGLLAVGVLFAPACGGDDSAVGGGSTDGGFVDGPNNTQDASSDAGDGGQQGPSIGGRNFVTRKFYLGDIDRDGGTSATAWQDFGTNIDGKTTTSGSVDVCTRFAGASANVQTDGPDGLDNSFGANLLPILISAAGADIDSQVNTSVEQGGATFMVDLTGLTDDSAQTLSPLPGQLFSGAHDGTPTWTTSDRWGVYKSSLVGATLASGAKANFSTATMTAGTWASNGQGDITLAVSGISMVIHHATISFSHASANHMTGGLISGVLDTEEVVEAVRIGLATLVSPALFCSGGTFDSIATQIRQASDILKDGTNAAGNACNGISAGIGFDADETAPPNTVIDDVVAVNPCGD